VAELATESRIEVIQDNYGDWRWYLIEGGETANRSDGYFETRDEAVQDARDVYHHVPLVVDGASYDLKELPAPPKIDAVLEAARAGIPAQQPLTPEQQKVMEETRARLIAMQDKADEDAKALIDAEKALTEQALATADALRAGEEPQVPSLPDEGIGLDGGPKEEDQPERPKVKRRGGADKAPEPEAPVEDPIAAQRARRQAMADEQ